MAKFRCGGETMKQCWIDASKELAKVMKEKGLKWDGKGETGIITMATLTSQNTRLKATVSLSEKYCLVPSPFLPSSGPLTCWRSGATGYFG